MHIAHTAQTQIQFDTQDQKLALMCNEKINDRNNIAHPHAELVFQCFLNTVTVTVAGASRW